MSAVRVLVSRLVRCSTGKRAVPGLPWAMLNSVESTRITRVGYRVSGMNLRGTVCVVWAAYVTGVSRQCVFRNVCWNWFGYWRISTKFVAQTWYIGHTVSALCLVRRGKAAGAFAAGPSLTVGLRPFNTVRHCKTTWQCSLFSQWKSIKLELIRVH